MGQQCGAVSDKQIRLGDVDARSVMVSAVDSNNGEAGEIDAREP